MIWKALKEINLQVILPLWSIYNMIDVLYCDFVRIQSVHGGDPKTLVLCFAVAADFKTKARLD